MCQLCHKRHHCSIFPIMYRKTAYSFISVRIMKMAKKNFAKLYKHISLLLAKGIVWANMHLGAPIVQETKTYSFVDYLIQHCLHNHFTSKKHMAHAIGVGYRTVLHVTNEPDRYKGASLVFQELVLYCISNGISIDEIAQAYLKRGGI